MLKHLEGWGEGDDEELQAMHAAVEVVVDVAAGEPDRALAGGERMAQSALATLTATHEAFRIGWPDTVEAALRLGHTHRARALLAPVEGLSQEARPPYLAAQLERLRALVEAAGEAPDELAVRAGLDAAADAFRALAYPYWTARSGLELGGWLLAHGDADEGESQLSGATATFEQLRAEPALAQLASTRAQAGSMRGALTRHEHTPPA